MNPPVENPRIGEIVFVSGYLLKILGLDVGMNIDLACTITDVVRSNSFGSGLGLRIEVLDYPELGDSLKINRWVASSWVYRKDRRDSV